MLREKNQSWRNYLYLEGKKQQPKEGTSEIKITRIKYNAIVIPNIFHMKVYE